MLPRFKITLDHDWEFVRRKAARDWLRTPPGSANVDLPHTWNEQDSFQDGVYYYQGWGSYRRTVRLDAADNKLGDDRWWLRSHGFYGTGEVWLNGARVTTFDGQYIGLDIDVTPWLNRTGENRLALRLTNRCRPWILPGIKVPDFLLYGGLTGGLWLERRPPTYIDQYATHVAYRLSDQQNTAELDLHCGVAGADAAGSEVTWRIVDANGLTVTESAAQNATHGGASMLQMENVRRWDTDDPYRYTALATLSKGGQAQDEWALPLGLRTAAFRPDEGFFLNGRRVPLRGVNRHECMPGFGAAVPSWLHREDAERIKAMGLNFVRCSHYPQHPDFLDACDACGILVYAEIASWKSVRGGAWLRRAKRQMQAMVQRDRHHPSIILWGMGNEGQHLRAYRELYAICKQLDPGRPVTYAENHFYRARRCDVVGLPDVWGVNYEFEAMESGRDAARQRCVVVTESSDCPWAQRGRGDAEERQWSVIQHDLDAMGSPPYLAGFALWNYNDYPTLRRGNFRRHSGVLDAWRLPKLAAYQLAARYGDPLATQKPDCIPAHSDTEATITLKPEQSHLDIATRSTMGIQVGILDKAGRLVDWQGQLTARVEGPARLRAYTTDRKLDITHGQGRLFITATGEAGTVRITVTGGNWADGEYIFDQKMETHT